MTESPPPFARTLLEAQISVSLCRPCRVCGPDAFFGEEGSKLFDAGPATFRRDRLAERLCGYRALLHLYGG